MKADGSKVCEPNLSHTIFLQQKVLAIIHHSSAIVLFTLEYYSGNPSCNGKIKTHPFTLPGQLFISQLDCAYTDLSPIIQTMSSIIQSSLKERKSSTQPVELHFNLSHCSISSVSQAFSQTCGVHQSCQSNVPPGPLPSLLSGINAKAE